MDINYCIQGSPEWLEARRGLPSASRAAEIVTPAKGEFSKSADKCMYSLIADCFAPGDDIPKFETYAMTRGRELEPVARAAFEAETGLTVTEVGLVKAADGICICSPDGLIKGGTSNTEWTEGLEIKCPTKDIHTEYVLRGELPDIYKPQVHWSMAVTGLNTWHFWSYHESPNGRKSLKPLHVIVRRDGYTEKIEAAMRKFVSIYREAYGQAVTQLAIPVELTHE